MQRMPRIVAAGLGFLALGGSVLAPAASAENTVSTTPWEQAAQGCSMAHCDPGMSDLTNLPLPTGPVAITAVSEDTGSNYALGCTSNGSRAACTMQFTNRGPSLRVFNPDGSEDVFVDNVLDRSAWTSVPMIATDGGIVATDNRNMVRFNPDGSVRWMTAVPTETEAGIPRRYQIDLTEQGPISPSITDSGIVVIGTAEGVVAGFDVETGAVTGATYLTDERFDGIFTTRNSPLVVGNRLYLTAEQQGGRGADNVGLFFAIDIGDPELGEAPFTVVGQPYAFRARSGGTPTFADGLVWFDGDGRDPEGPQSPVLFGMEMGSDGPIPAAIIDQGAPGAASPAVDPRGGVWSYAYGIPEVKRTTYDAVTGDVAVEIIDINQYHQPPGRRAVSPASALTVSEGPNGPAMVFSIAETFNDAPRSIYLVAIDLTDESLLWKVKVGDGLENLSPGQFPVAMDGDEPVIFFSTFSNGHYMLRAES